jgi:metallo-beta-lactamase class B
MIRTLNMLILGCLCSIQLISQPGTSRLQISHLAGDFYIYTTYSKYKGTMVGANGMYLVTSAGAVLFDSPWDTTQFQPLLDSIRLRHHADVKLCIATHFHEDRSGGLEYYRQHGIRTYTTRHTDELSKARGQKRAEFLILKDTLFRLGQYSFETYFGGAGHSPDNIVIWCRENRIIYGGCLVKSTDATDLGNINDASVAAWANTIKKIQQRFKDFRYVIPGHGQWQSRDALDHTLRLVNDFLRTAPEKSK